jgi:GlpG protein
MIGHLENEPSARTFSNYLYVKGIRNQIEAEADGTWALWIHAEEEIEQARNLLRNYLANPNDPKVKHQADKAQDLRSREQEQASANEKRYFDRDRLFPSREFFGMGRLTAVLIGISVAVYVMSEYSSMRDLTDYLKISSESARHDLPEVREWQFWRLLTPIFIHYGLIHILFNMLCLRDLGSMIESRLSTLQLALIVLVVGVVSNLGQYCVSGPDFGGMSGVVYGLLGYVWMRGKFDPGSGLFLHPSVVVMMLVWLAFGYTNYFSIANTAHSVGLAVGIVWGFLAARLRAG